MAEPHLRITYIDGPTALLELDGVRLLTDPTFDPTGSEYPNPGYVLRKNRSPAMTADDIGTLDAVLLSHDHHRDNLDDAGRAVVARAPVVLTTTEGAARLGSNAVGLEPWQAVDLPAKEGGSMRVTATPAQHGAPGKDRGPVVGFALTTPGASGAVYVSGDTVWFDGVAQVARAFDVRVAVLFMGAARVAVAGPEPLTFTAEEGVEVARAMPEATIVPLHYEGWEHFSESRAEITEAFARAGLLHRVRWLAPGVTEQFHISEM